MPSSRRIVAVLLAAFAAACSTSTAAPTGCRTDAQCPAAARCHSGVCTADGTPVAVLRPLGLVTAFALVQLDGSQSHDPDGDDALAAHLWTVRAVDARCAPPEIAGREPLALVRFGCPGRYEISLTVRDQLGVESTPAVAEVNVLPASGQASVVAGPDVATEHVCAGRPLLCRTADHVDLAAAADPGLALRWSVEAPLDRPLDGTRRVRFSDPGAPETRAFIETDGVSISGDWIFRVEARDAYGVVGAAYTRVSVRNRAPVVSIVAAGPFPHVFDAARSVFASSGSIAWSAVDPDGDPLSVSATWRHLGDGGGTFDGEVEPGAVSFLVEVPYEEPGDALRLRGGVDLLRRIEVDARDVNRGEGRAATDVEIGNRPPVPAGGAVDLRVPHVFDRDRSRYVATLRGGAWIDPDGDPMSGGAGTAPCETITVAGGEARVECAVPFDGTPVLDQLVGFRTFSIAVRDPWDLASGVPVHTVEILNSRPTLSRTASPATVCSAVTLPMPDYFVKIYCLDVQAVTFDVAPAALDPDGDPLFLTPTAAQGGTVAPDRATCTTAECVPFRFFQPALRRCLDLFVPPVSFLRASDGVDEVEIGVSPDQTRC